MVMFKQKGVWLILAALLMAASLASTAFARTAPGTVLPTPSKVLSQKELNANAWFIWTTNYGPFVNPQANSGGFWRDRAYSYIFGAGMMVGAEDEAGNRAVAVGYNPNSGTWEFGPVSLDDTSYGRYLSDPYARVYLSSDAADYGAWPLLDEKGKKIIKSRQDSYALSSDENPAFTTSGDRRLGVALAQHSYAWNYADNNDIVFFYFKVHNISDGDLLNVYIGPCNDCDIGDESEGFANDRTAFDYTRNLGMQFQDDDEPGWDKTGVVGFRYFESPINNTGETIHVVDNYFDHYILPDSALGMTAFKIFTISQDPATDEQRYLEMMGINWWSMLLDSYDEWGATTEGDKRFLMSSGPFNLPSGAFATTCIGVIGALDTTSLKGASDVAQSIYDNDFQLATPPAAPTLIITPGDKRVILSWDRKAETTPDPYWEGLPDTAGWYPYFPGSWVWLAPASQLLVDSFNVRTTDSSTVIARGAVNPGTDTLFAHYSQRDLYLKYDFQAYKIYRARNMVDMADPARREPVGTFYTNTEVDFDSTTCSFPGGSGYMYDKKDGIQVVKDLDPVTSISPEGVVLLPKYDTLGNDRGLIYTLIDSNVVNGFGWYYGVSAIDYQNNVFFTHKCPTTLVSNPTENATYGVARAPLADLDPATVTYTTFGATDVKVGGTVDYNYQLSVVPTQIKNDTFRLKWLPTTKTVDGTILIPKYSYELHDMQWQTIDTVIGIDTTTVTRVIDTVITSGSINPTYAQMGSDIEASYFGYTDDEILFGGVIFKPYYLFHPELAAVESLDIYESDAIIYPLDSIFTQVNGHVNFDATTGFWQWRGSDYEIRWRDTVVLARNCLTATVWDMTNNVMVPLETGVVKKAMTKSSWCFNPLTTAGTSYVDSSAISAYGMYICGVTIYFNKRNNGTLRRMIWPLRPHTGDVWTVTSLGVATPSDGEVVTFITTPAAQIAPTASLLDGIKVVPNPYLVRHNWDVSKNYPNVHFTHLPAKCTIRIFNLAGDLVRVLNHESAYDENNGIEKWDLLTTYDKRPASGVYIYQIDAPGIGTKIGKFAIIK